MKRSIRPYAAPIETVMPLLLIASALCVVVAATLPFVFRLARSALGHRP